jgi:hypothetical protein
MELLLYSIHLTFHWLSTSLSYNPLIASLGEGASASQVLPKGLVARDCWCTLGVNLGSAPVPTNGFVARTRIFMRECQGGSHPRERFKSG